MKALLLSLSLCVLAAPAWASPQTEKMKTCNADAKTKDLKGDERKAFMKTCLSKDGGASTAKTTQQDKMKTCNADAKTKNLAGDDRKKFMSDCLKA
jgi:psiF repeat